MENKIVELIFNLNQIQVLLQNLSANMRWLKTFISAPKYKSIGKHYICLGFLILFTTNICTSQVPDKELINISQLIDTINQKLADNYIFPDKAQLIAKHLRSQAKRVSTITLRQTRKN